MMSHLFCSLCKHNKESHYNTVGEVVPCLICGCPSLVLPHIEMTTHYSSNKPGVDQVPPFIIEMIGEVFTYGENKYGKHNWKKGTYWSEFIGSALRHFLRFCMGEWLDRDSKLPHLAHTMVNIIFLIYYHTNQIGTDDRDPTGAHPEKAS